MNESLLEVDLYFGRHSLIDLFTRFSNVLIRYFAIGVEVLPKKRKGRRVGDRAWASVFHMPVFNIFKKCGLHMIPGTLPCFFIFRSSQNSLDILLDG